MEIRVECYAGYRNEEEPRAFWLGERRLEVAELVDRWLSPEQRYFKVRASDGDFYILRHDEIGADGNSAPSPGTDGRARRPAPGQTHSPEGDDSE